MGGKKVLLVLCTGYFNILNNKTPWSAIQCTFNTSRSNASET